MQTFRLWAPGIQKAGILISKALLPGKGARYIASTWQMFVGLINAFFVLCILKGHRFYQQTLIKYFQAFFSVYTCWPLMLLTVTDSRVDKEMLS